MAGLGNLATTAIITKGLTGGYGPLDPCKNGIITSWFSLYYTGITPAVKHSGGGPYPRDAWNKFGPGDIQNFYKPVPQQMQYYVVPRDQEAKYFKRSKHVVLHFKMGTYEIEKEYSVPENHSQAIIKVLNFANITRERIGLAVKNVKRIATKVIVTVSKLHKRR